MDYHDGGKLETDKNNLCHCVSEPKVLVALKGVWLRDPQIGQRTIQTITDQCAKRHNFPANGSTGCHRHQWQRKQNNAMSTKTIEVRHHVWPLIIMEQ